MIRNDYRIKYCCNYCGGDFMHKPYEISDLVFGKQYYYHSKRCWDLQYNVQSEKKDDEFSFVSKSALGVIENDQ